MREEELVRKHERVLEKEQDERVNEDIDYRRLYERHISSQNGRFGSLLQMMKQRAQKEEGI